MPEDLKAVENLPSPVVVSRKGCDPIMATQRGKMQSQRLILNQQLCKQMRLRSGAENLFNATSNAKVKETVSLELSFVNSNVQLIKEELNEINSKVEPYQSKSGKAVSIPMQPIGLKETNDLKFADEFENFIASHYKDDPSNFQEEIADFADLRTSVRTPARSFDGVALLLSYFNQLNFIENRFLGSNSSFPVYFHWYDAISGVPATQQSVYLEKASVLFNVGALYSQLGTREDRSRKSGIETAIDAFQRSAGAFEYVRNNFANSPTPDLSRPFLNALSRLMLAQAQECVLELKVLGGFEIELGKCLSIARAAMKVAEKYEEADRSFRFDAVKTYVPYSWANMVQVKAHHYRALSHYYAGLGLLEQHEFAEPVEIEKLLSSLYDDLIDSDVPKPEDVAQKKEDRRKLGKSHLRHAVFSHEQALQTHSLCKIARTIDILKEYLLHAHRRSLAKFAEVDSEEDFFDLVETPSIQGYAENEARSISLPLKEHPCKDIFHRLGPISTFSVHNRVGTPRVVKLSNGDTSCPLELHGESPATVEDVDEKLKMLGIMNDDVILSIDDDDMRWSDSSHVAELIAKKRNSPLTIKLTNLSKVSNDTVKAPLSDTNDEMKMAHLLNNNATSRLDRIDLDVHDEVSHRNKKNKQADHSKKRHSFGIFHGLKLRALQNPFSTITENSSSISRPNVRHQLGQQRSSTTSRLRSNSDFLPENTALDSGRRSDC